MKLKTLNPDGSLRKQEVALLPQSPTLKALLQSTTELEFTHEEDPISVVNLNACIDCLQDEGYGVANVLELYERDTISQWLLAAFLKVMALNRKQDRAAEFAYHRTTTVNQVVDQMIRDGGLKLVAKRYRAFVKTGHQVYATATLLANNPMKPWFGKTSLDYDVGSVGSRIALHKLRDKVRNEIIRVVSLAWDLVEPNKEKESRG